MTTWIVWYCAVCRPSRVSLDIAISFEAAQRHEAQIAVSDHPMCLAVRPSARGGVDPPRGDAAPPLQRRAGSHPPTHGRGTETRDTRAPPGEISKPLSFMTLYMIYLKFVHENVRADGRLDRPALHIEAMLVFCVGSTWRNSLDLFCDFYALRVPVIYGSSVF